MNPIPDESNSLPGQTSLEPQEEGQEESNGLSQFGVELLSDQIEGALRDIIDSLELSDEFIRQRVTREARRNHAFWRGFSKLVWDSIISDHRTLEQLQETDPAYDDFRDTSLNIYRATGETMVAAISSTLPQLVFEPCDPENPDDLMAAKAFPKLKKKIERDNEASLLLSRAAFIRFNEHFVAYYNYIEHNENYGQVKKPIYATRMETSVDHSCPQCNQPVDEPDEMGLTQCSTCEGFVQPVQSQNQYPITEQTGEETYDKCQEHFEVHGSLNVKIASNAQRLEQSPYLIYEHEEDIGLVREAYPWMYEKIEGGESGGLTGLDANDRLARTNIDWRQSFGINVITVKECWLRPAAYNHLDLHREEREELLKMFPKGCKATWLNSEFCSVEESVLEEHWSIESPAVSRFLYSEPQGNFQIAPQQMRDEVLDLMLESLEHGIVETFVDTNVLDLNHYGLHSKKPGLFFPTNKPAGESLASSFYATQAALYPKEGHSFIQMLDQSSQQVSGIAAPLWGGPSTGGTGTLGEYQGSTQKSLQRQMIPWREITGGYAKGMKKACEEYKKYMLEDESFPEKQGNDFIAVWLRTEELSGKIGKVYVENSDKIPVTWDQKEDRFLQMLNTNNQAVMQLLFHPNNAQLVATYLGFEDMYIPGADDKNKQLVQIGQMLLTLTPIPPDPNTDNNDICIEVLKSWFNGPSGMDAQQSNPQGYVAVQQQLLARLQIQAQQQMQAQMQQPLPEGNENA